MQLLVCLCEKTFRATVAKSIMADFTSEYVQSGEETGNDGEGSEDFDKEAFSEAVRRFRCLWDTNDRTYKDRNIKANAWRHLALVFQREGKSLAPCISNVELQHFLDESLAFVFNICFLRCYAVTVDYHCVFFIYYCKDIILPASSGLMLPAPFCNLIFFLVKAFYFSMNPFLPDI